jgi:hypothetical protein
MTTDPEIKASRLPARNGYGQNGSALPSSLTPGQTKNPIADVSPPACNVPGLAAADQHGARVKPTAYKSHDGLPARTVHDGSPGGVPAATIRRDSGKRLLK